MEWQNYGDIGYLDEGGVQIRQTDREDMYDVIIAIQHPDDETKMFAGHTTVCPNEYKDDELVKKYAEESFGADVTDEQYAVAVAETYGLVELSATAFNQNGAQAAYSMSLDAYTVDKFTLARGLQMMGIGIHGRLTDLKKLESHFNLMPMYDYLETMYGNPGYEIGDITDELPNCEFGIKADFEDSGEEWTVDSDDANEIIDDVIYSISSYLNTLDPLIAMDNAGRIAVVPYYKDKDNNILSANDVEDAVNKLIPKEVDITEYGETVDTDRYSPPYRKERQIKAEFECTFDVIEFLMNTAKENIAAVAADYESKRIKDLAYDMISSVNCSVTKNNAGKYDVVDNLSNAYRAINCETVADALNGIDTLLDISILDYLSNELNSSDEVKTNCTPQTISEWRRFAAQPENQGFINLHINEFDVMFILDDPDKLAKEDLSDIGMQFHPEQHIHYTSIIRRMMTDNDRIHLCGNDYTPTENAKSILTDDKDTNSYHITLNNADLTFDLVDKTTVQKEKETKLNKTLSDFTQQFGIVIETVPKSASWELDKFALFDKEAGEYVKNDVDTTSFTSVTCVMTALSSKTERIMEDLADEAADFIEQQVANGRDDADIEVPQTLAEWIAFAGRPHNKTFADTHRFEIDVLQLAYDPSCASLQKAMLIQNETIQGNA